jgi:hypothetical protein
MMMSESSPAAFGMDKQGIAESGRALRFKLLRTLAKINRKKLYFNQGLKNILYAAQVLDVEWGSAKYEPKEPQIEWADGLPEDEEQITNIHAKRVEGGIESRETAVRSVLKLEGKSLQDEMDRINEDEEMRNPFKTTDFGNDNGGEQ